MTKIETEAFVTWLETRDHSAATIRSYTSDLRSVARWFTETLGEPFEPGALTVLDVRAYRQYMLHVRRWKGNTINRRLAMLRAYCRWAQEMGLREDDPTLQVAPVKTQPRAPRWLTLQEQRTFQRALLRVSSGVWTASREFRQQQREMLGLFLLNTGLRLGEVCQVEVSDLTLNAQAGRVQVVHGKGRKQRLVPLNRTVREALAPWLHTREAWLAARQKETAALFISQRGTALRPRTVQKIMETLSATVGFTVTPHILRHTFAKNLVDHGVTLEKVAALLGHSSLNTTRLYVTPGVQDLVKAVEALP